MNEGLKTTFDTLAATENEACIGVLIPGLDSPHQQIQEEALRVLLRRRSSAGQREVIRRLHWAPEQWLDILAEFRGRISAALRDSVLGSDKQTCANGCRAILKFAEYDLMPALINAAEDRANPNADTAAETLLELAELLYLELASPRDYRNRRDPQIVRKHVVGSLENSVKRFKQHQRYEIIEACLLLANRGNATIRQILGDPYNGAYLAVVETLTHSPSPGVMRLLLGYLEDPNAPSAAIQVIAHRGDPAFLKHLLNKIGFEPSTAVVRNLKRIKSIAWLREDFSTLGELDDAAQHGVLQMALASGMKRLEVFGIIEYLLEHGKIGGRRAAATALEDYNGGEANALALKALDDPDPQVQASALGQLRPKGIHGAMARLLEHVDSPHQVIRNAVRDALHEFNFQRFLAAFDLMEEDVRESTGPLVRKIDPLAIPGLVEEMEASSRTRRLRAIDVALAMDALAEMEKPLLRLISDEDHIIRSEAARVLRYHDTAAVRAALTRALSDRSTSVQDMARESLEHLQ